MIKRILDYQVTIGRLVLLAILIGIPYGLIGLVWALNHTDHLANLSGLDKLFSFLGEIVAWPVLLISNLTLV